MFILFSFAKCFDDGLEQGQYSVGGTWRTFIDGATINVTFDDSRSRFKTSISNQKDSLTLAGFTDDTWSYYYQESNILYIKTIVRGSDTLITDNDMYPEWILRQFDYDNLEMIYVGDCPSEGNIIKQYKFSAVK
jgi:hypothetical protein